MSPSYQILSHFRHCWPNKKPCSQGATTTYLRRSETALALDPRRGRGRFARIGVERWPKRTPDHVEHLPITARWATEEEHAEAAVAMGCGAARLARVV